MTTLCVGLPFGTAAAQTAAAPVVPVRPPAVVEGGASATERSGNWGYRVQAKLGLPGTGLSAGGEWASDSLLNTYAGTARYRFGLGWLGAWPLAGWRGSFAGTQNAVQGPEVGIGLDLSFSPSVPSLIVEGTTVLALDGQVLPQLRINSRYRVLDLLDLDASYRLENWAAWTSVWGLGAHLVW